MWRRITSPVGARTRKVVPAIIALLMALMILTLACEEAQALSASGGAAGVGGGVALVPALPWMDHSLQTQVGVESEERASTRSKSWAVSP